MTCDELMDLLFDYHGGELVAEQRTTVEVHISGCPRCGPYVATYTHTVTFGRALPKCGALPPDVEARLRKVIESELPPNAQN
jgi:anti-sigma factor RsiW